MSLLEHAATEDFELLVNEELPESEYLDFENDEEDTVKTDVIL